MRLGRLKAGKMVGEGRVAAPRQAELGASVQVGLLVDHVVGQAFDGLAGGEAQGVGAGSPPAARQLAGLGRR